MAKIQNVTIVGANGKLGPAILNQFQLADEFNVTVLSRASSKSIYPENVHEARVSDDLETTELIEAFKGQDAVIVVFGGTLGDLQIRLADAAAQAGVKRFIPADFGSCDSSNPRVLELMKLYRTKAQVREHLQKLAEHGSLSWTSLVCGHFFDFGLKSGLLQADLKTYTMRVFDGGETKWSACTIKRIAEAVVRILQHEEETKNRMLYVQSFSITQNQLLKSLEHATGQDWQVENWSSEKYIAETKAELDINPDDGEVLENLVSIMGMIEADWETKKDFANDFLGLKDEALDEVVKGVLE